MKRIKAGKPTVRRAAALDSIWRLSPQVYAARDLDDNLLIVTMATGKVFRVDGLLADVLSHLDAEVPIRDLLKTLDSRAIKNKNFVEQADKLLTQLEQMAVIERS